MTRTLLLSTLLWRVASCQTPEEIVRLSCERDWEQLKIRQQYTFRDTEELLLLDKRGNTKERKVKTQETLWIDGTEYTRVLEKDGKPLSEKEAQREQQKMDKEIEKRRTESPGARQKRLSKREKELAEAKEFREQIPQAFEWKLTGEEPVNGYLCYRLQAEPKARFRPRGDLAAKFLPKLHGTIWINKASYEWLKVDSELLEPLSFGLAMVRVNRGARMQFEQDRINGELWFPSWFRLTASARALLVFGANMSMFTRFHDFRKYQVDSNVTLTGETP